MKWLLFIVLAVSTITSALCKKETKTEKLVDDAIGKLFQERMEKKIQEVANNVHVEVGETIGTHLKDASTSLFEAYKKKAQNQTGQGKEKNPPKKAAKALKSKAKIKLVKSAHHVKNLNSKVSPASGAAVHQNKGPRHRKHNAGVHLQQAPNTQQNNVNNPLDNVNNLQNNANQQKPQTPGPTNVINGMPLPGKQQQQQQQPQQDQLNNMPDQQQAQQQQQNLPSLQTQMPQPMPQMMSAMVPISPCLSNPCAPQVPPPMPPPPPMCTPLCPPTGQAPPPVVCPASCHLQCFSYCPSKCCKKGMEKK